MTNVPIDLDAACELCEAKGILVSGADVLACPACSPPEVKYEFHRIDLTGLTLKSIRCLLDSGWEIRDACYALKESGGAVVDADKILRERACKLAEAADMDLVALHSEIDKKSKQDSFESIFLQALKNIDIETLWTLQHCSDFFCRHFDDKEQFANWLRCILNEVTIDLVFKYVRLRVQAFKWYPKKADSFFKNSDRQIFTSPDVLETLMTLNPVIEEALYSLSSNVFNQIDVDPEIEVFELKRSAETIELDD